MDKQICTSHGHFLPVEPGKMRDYNPSQTGHIHYFTTLGNQIRSRRVFSVDNVTNGTKSHDDESTTPLCSNKYPSVALKGSTYMSFMILSTARALLWILYYWWEWREKRSCKFINFLFESSSPSNISQLCMKFGGLLFQSGMRQYWILSFYLSRLLTFMFLCQQQ